MTKQEIRSERATKKIFNFLNAVHLAKGADGIIYAGQLNKLASFHKVTNAMSTFMVKKGYAVKVNYGVYKIIHSPSFSSAEVLKKCQNKFRSTTVSNRKKNEPKNVLKATSPSMFTSNITKAISLLKQAGYKVLKPVTQYEEL